MPSLVAYCEFEVSLQGISPKIWRRFRLRKNSTFHELHDTIQRACGWQDYHLYAFHPVGNREFLAASPHYAEAGEEVPLAPAIRIDTFFGYGLPSCIYEYDFGDGWEHLVELKSIERLPSQGRRKILGGERAFPPEDCGGVPGYYQCLEAFRISAEELGRLDEGTREELLSVRTWFGDWDPERFDFEATAKEMKRRANW